MILGTELAISEALCASMRLSAGQKKTLGLFFDQVADQVIKSLALYRKGTIAVVPWRQRSSETQKKAAVARRDLQGGLQLQVFDHFGELQVDLVALRFCVLDIFS